MRKKFINLTVIVLLLSLLVGCNSSSSISDVSISGKAIDGYISGATVTIKNKDTNETISTVYTDSNGSFEFNKPKGIDLIVEISDGNDTSTGEPFSGVMKNVIGKDSNSSLLNITPITSLIAQLVQSGVDISTAQITILRALNVDLESLDSDPIEVLKLGSVIQRTNAASMMKSILTIQKFAELVSSVSDDVNSSYIGVFNTIANKLNNDSSLKLDTILDANNTDSLIDEISNQSNNSLEQSKFNAIKELTKNAIIILNDLNTTELRDASDIDAKITINASAIETLIIPLKVKLKGLREATNSTQIALKKEEALNIVKATVSLGGIKGISTTLKTKSSAASVSDFARSFLSDSMVQTQSSRYNSAISSGKTIAELMHENENIEVQTVVVKNFGSIKGKLYNKTTQVGLENIKITITDSLTQKETSTLSTGIFTIDNIAEGNITIVIDKNDTDMPRGARGIWEYNLMVVKDQVNTLADVGFTFDTTPTITTTPTNTLLSTTTIEVTGDMNNIVFVNNTQVATIGETGRVNIDLNTSTNGDNSFIIVVKNSSNEIIKTFESFIVNKDTITRADALKLLRQASFVTVEDEISYIMTNGYDSWIENQLNIVGDLDNNDDSKYGYLESLLIFLNKIDSTQYPASIITDPYNNLEEYPDSYRSSIFSNSIWWGKVFNNKDQLRQRVAYALSQILVVSKESPAGGALKMRAESLANYYDILVKHSFGNYRDLLKEVTMSATMSYYLTFLGSSKENNETGTAPDENYARELMQLFTIGLYELNLDGSKEVNSDGNPVASYTQDDVSELSKVFTGWDWRSRKILGDDGYWHTRKYGSTNYYAHSLIEPIEFHSEYHDYGAKSVLGQSIESGLDGEADIDKALDILMANSNMAPHVCRHLIMRLVSSNPTPEYIRRVSAVFNDNGQGIKGDLKATIKAILTDDEARGKTEVSNFGKVEEFTIATTHFLSLFKVKPLPFITFFKLSSPSLTSRFENTYWFNPTNQFYPQSALSAESVFNFYSPEYVPSDSYFATNNLVAPELEIRTNNALIGFSKMIYTLFNYEKYRMLTLGLYNPSSATTMLEWTTNDNPTSSGFKHLYLDLTDIYEYFEMQVDNDTNGDFSNLNSSTNGHRAEMSDQGIEATKKLLDYLYNRMIGTSMPEDYKDELISHLQTIELQNSPMKAEKIIRTAIRAITTSPLFMVIK